MKLKRTKPTTNLVATTGFCITSSSLSDDTLSESEPVAKKRDIAAEKIQTFSDTKNYEISQPNSYLP